MDSSKELYYSRLAKEIFLNYILMFNSFGADIWEEKIMEDLQSKNIIEKNLVKYLIDFINYFYKHFYISPKQTVDCFKVYSNIIDRSVDRIKSKELKREMKMRSC